MDAARKRMAELSFKREAQRCPFEDRVVLYEAECGLSATALGLDAKGDKPEQGVSHARVSSSTLYYCDAWQTLDDGKLRWLYDDERGLYSPKITRELDLAKGRQPHYLFAE